MVMIGPEKKRILKNAKVENNGAFTTHAWQLAEKLR